MTAKTDEPVEHKHRWGRLEQSRFAGTWHRKCLVEGCRFINAYDDDEDDDDQDDAVES